MEIQETAYRRLFDELSKNDTQYVFTPPRLIRKMMGKITFSPNSKVLVWYNVEFLIYLVKEIGLSPKNIYIYTNTKDKLILEKQGYNVVYQDQVNLDKVGMEYKDMKFDLILGNPPFSKNKKEPKKLWSLFVVKSFDLCKSDGKVALITPSSWISSTNFAHSTIKNKLQYVNLSNETSEYFGNTGGTQKFIYFIANNKDTENCSTEFDGDVILDMNPCQTEYPPVKSTSHILYSIVKKLSESNLPTHEWVRFDKSDSSSGVVVSMSKGSGYDVTHLETDEMSVSRYKLICDELYGWPIANNLNLKLYRILRWVIRSGPALAGNFKNIPIPNQIVTDQELYDILSLSSEEIEYVEQY